MEAAGNSGDDLGWEAVVVGGEVEDGVVAVVVDGEDASGDAVRHRAGGDAELLGPDEHGEALRAGGVTGPAPWHGPERRGHGAVVGVPVDQVGFADEGGQFGVDRVVVEVSRGAGLGDGASAEDGDEPGGGEGFVLVVGDEEDRGAGPLEYGADLGAHAGAQAGVERRERLVEQHDAWFGGERPGEGDALLLAAGELMGIAVGEVLDADDGEQRRRVGVARLADPLSAVAGSARSAVPTFVPPA